MKKKNELSYKDLKMTFDTDVFDFNTTEELEEIVQAVSDSINLSKLRRSVDNAIKILSGVGDPSFGADAKVIALDNQKRLNLIYLLLDRFNILEAGIKNFRRNKMNCKNNDEFLYEVISSTKDILGTINKYGEFRFNEYQETQKYLEDIDRKRLNSSNKEG